MKSIYELLVEALVPTHENTYKDDQGKLRWKSNHHLVSQKYFNVVQNAVSNTKLELPDAMSLSPNTVKTLVQMIRNGGLLSVFQYEPQLVLENPYLSNMLEKISGFTIQTEDDVQNAVYMYEERLESDTKNKQHLDRGEMNNMAGFHLMRIQKLQKCMDYFGLDESFIQEVNDKLKEATDREKTTINIRCNSSILETILSGDGRFKTQFETGNSNGALSFGMRNAVELIGQNYDSRQEDQTKRPIYGYLGKASKNTNQNEFTISSRKIRIEKSKNFKNDKMFDFNDFFNDLYSTKHYGDCVCVMNDSLRKNTSVSFGDTLNNSLTSSPIDNPTILSTNYPYYMNEMMDEYDSGENDIFKNLTSKKVIDSLSGDDAEMEYIEAQIQGGVSKNDIDCVILYYNKKKNYDSTAELLDKHNIPYIKVFDVE